MKNKFYYYRFSKCHANSSRKKILIFEIIQKFEISYWWEETLKLLYIICFFLLVSLLPLSGRNREKKYINNVYNIVLKQCFLLIDVKLYFFWSEICSFFEMVVRFRELDSKNLFIFKHRYPLQKYCTFTNFISLMKDFCWKKNISNCLIIYYSTYIYLNGNTKSLIVKWPIPLLRMIGERIHK